MEDSPIGLDKWLPAIWLIVNAKNGTSSHEMGRSLGITQKSAWFLLHRIRLAMQEGHLEKFAGETEVDETFIGGKARNMHKGKRKVKGTGPIGKAAVMGLLERHGEGKSRVRVTVVPSRRKPTLQAEVRKHVEPGATVYTDALASYEGMDDYTHKVVDHAECYVKDKVIHTNGLENFWSLLKRSIRGTYVNVQPFHLFRYLDEQAFRFNNRKDNDAGRFIEAVAAVAGRRLTYQQLIGN
jgi:transposase-like protein